MRRAERHWLSVLAVGLLLGLAAAQEPAEELAEVPRGGLLEPGSLAFRCEADTCRVSWPLREDVNVAAGLQRVFAGHPGGRYPLHVRTERGDIDDSFTICGGETLVTIHPERIEVRGDPCPPSGTVTLAGLPSGTSVWIEHVPVELDDAGHVHLRAGEVVVRVEKAGFRAQEETVFVAADAVVELTFTLSPEPGTLVLELATEATTVTLDDRAVLVDGAPGPDPVPGLRIAPDALHVPWPAGEVPVSVARPDHDPQAFVVTIEPGTTLTRAVALEPHPASITFTAFPAEADVEVDGEQVAVGEPLTLPPGPYALRATAAGFDTFEGVLEVIAGEHREIAIELEAPPVIIRFAGAPAGTTVRVDGAAPRTLDATASIAVTPGQRVLRLEAPGYAALTLERTIAPGQEHTIDVQMHRSAILRLAIAPTGAVLRVDGERADPSRAGTIELAAGRYQLVVEAPGHEPFETAVTLEEGTVSDLAVALVALPGRIHLPPLPEGVVVRVDGVPRGVWQGAISPVQPGAYELQLGGGGYETRTLRVVVGPGEDVHVERIELVPRPATLVLNDAPAGTRVKVGDADVVVYRQPLQIPVGKHEVWIAAEGYGRVRIDIEAGPGQRVVVPVRFD